MIIRLICFVAFIMALTRCSTVKDFEFGDGKYAYREAGKKYQKVYVHTEEDSIHIVSAGTGNATIYPTPGVDKVLLKKSFDVDVVTSLFKYRPGTSGFPRQLNTSFNGNVFFGYRIDRFQLHQKKTPAGTTRELRHRGITVGGFVGMGSTFVSSWTTNYQTTDEYDGFILSRGLSALAAVNSLTVGVSVGWDYLTDRDKNIWIYQNKPWIGLTLGLNLN